MKFCAAIFALSLIVMGCHPGAGTGQITGNITIGDCDLSNAQITINPDFFGAEISGSALLLIVQHGSDLQIVSDGIFIDVANAANVATMSIGEPIAFSSADPAAVSLSLTLNATCPAIDMPVVLRATSGTITFDAIYAPTIDSNAQQISAHLSNVRVVDSGFPTTRFGLINGQFEFTYTRGRPAQHYP